jgi:PAS domain S-box-containing protein
MIWIFIKGLTNLTRSSRTALSSNGATTALHFLILIVSLLLSPAIVAGALSAAEFSQIDRSLSPAKISTSAAKDESPYFLAKRKEAEALFLQQQTTVGLYDRIEHYPTDSKLRYFEDATTQLTIDDIKKLDIRQDFTHNDSGGPLNLSYSESAIWIAIPLLYKGKEAVKDYWLHVDTPLVEDIEFYVVSNNEVTLRKSSGYAKAMAARDLLYPTSLLSFSITQNEDTKLYLRITSDYALHLPIAIYSPKGFAEQASISMVLSGVVLGAIAFMCIFNIFLFITVREKAYFYYVLYIFCYLVALISERLHGLHLVGEVPFFLHKDFLATYIWLVYFFALLMAKHFIDFRQVSPARVSLLKFFLRVTAVMCAVSFFAPPTAAVQWAAIGTMMNLIFLCWYAFGAVRYKIPGGGTYLTAWLFTCSGIVLYALSVNGKIPFNFFTWNAIQVGILFQLVLLSFAMSDRIKNAQKMALDATAFAMNNLQRYQSLFSNAIEGFFQMTLDKKFIDANPAMIAMLGFSSLKKLQAKTDNVLSACYCDEKVLQHVASELDEKRELSGIQAQFINARGESRWAESSLRFVPALNNEPAYIEGVFVDITEKKAKEALEQEREHNQLMRQIADASAAAKSQFLANMSHEIRTPLTAIIGYGDSLIDESLSEDETKTSAEIIVRSGRHLLELINDILDHSRIDADKLQVDIAPVMLPDLIAEVKSYFEPKARDKEINFSVNYHFPLPETIQTDPTRLKQILINLCGNALKFTARGSITIDIRCEVSDELLHITVTDTGIGLKPEQLSRLFDAFAQASAATAREYGGTGLGLSISKRLAELLGGTIKASSTYGKGSDFEVIIATGMLETAKLIQDNSEFNQRQTKVLTRKAPQLKGSILYAEDNEVNRRLVELLVKKTGADITLVVNGAEAVEKACKETFDLILMDIQMPVMDGLDATVAIRQSGNQTPIVALTANVMAEDIHEYREMGCDDYLAKPIDKKRFYATLAHYLQPAAEISLDK